MESKIIIQQTSQSEARSKSGASPSQPVVNLGIGTPAPSASVQRIVRTPTGTQIYLSGLTPNTRAITGSNVNKRSFSPSNDNQPQPPAKIKLTYNTSNSNVPIVQPKTEPSWSNGGNTAAVRNVTVASGGAQSPRKVIHVTNNKGLPNNVRRFVLSPAKSTGKISVVPYSTASQARPGASTGITRTASFNSSTAVAPTVQNRQKILTLSPQKLIIKGPQDNTVVCYQIYSQCDGLSA